MRVLVFGATGRTGNEVVKQSIAAGYHVTAFLRDASRIRLVGGPELTIVEGEVTEAYSVDLIFKNYYDAVFSLLGPRTPVFSAPELVVATHNIVDAMKRTENERLIHLSMVSTRGDSKHLGPIFRFFAPFIAHNLIREHKTKENIISSSGLNWTIFQPPFLTEDPLNSGYVIRDHIERSDSSRKLRLSRRNLAEAMLKSIDDPESFRKKLFISE